MIDTSNKRQIAWDKYSDKFKGLGQWQAFEAGWEAAKEQAVLLAERHFCQRCGKRASKNIDDVHSCTPPRDIHNET